MNNRVLPALLVSRHCSSCPVGRRAFCSRSDVHELKRLESLKRYRQYAAGDIVAIEGLAMPFVASVVAGTARLTQSTRDGRIQMVGLLLPSDFLGNPKRSLAAYTVTAASDLVLCCFERTQFVSIMRDVPSIAQRMLEMKLNELDAAREWMLLLGRKSARERVASLLIYMARKNARAGSRHCSGRLEVDLRLTRRSIAEYLGMTLETVSRQMTTLRNEGFLEFGSGRKVIIRDFQSLSAETGDDTHCGIVT